MAFFVKPCEAAGARAAEGAGELVAEGLAAGVGHAPVDVQAGKPIPAEVLSVLG